MGGTITGARVSVGPNGTFVHLGRNGFYYRKKLSNSKKKNKRVVEDVDLNECLQSTKIKQ